MKSKKYTMEHYLLTVKYSDLSIPLKIAVWGGYISLISFIIGFFYGLGAGL